MRSIILVSGKQDALWLRTKIVGRSRLALVIEAAFKGSNA